MTAHKKIEKEGTALTIPLSQRDKMKTDIFSDWLNFEDELFGTGWTLNNHLTLLKYLNA